jgi:hypothetical protein
VVFATLFGIVVGSGLTICTANSKAHSKQFFSGPSGANIFTPRSWGSTSDEITNDITLEVTRIVLALGVFAIGVGSYN